jgi:2,3-bisphosphoglycerate-independent phosphoglycerate mutase
MKNEITVIPAQLSINEVAIKKSADKMIITSKAMVITSQNDMEDAATAARSMKALAKKVDDIRVSRVDPLNKQVKEINALLKGGMIDPLKEAASALEGKMLVYTKEQQRIAEAEAAARAAEEKERLFAEMILAEDAGEDDQFISFEPAAPVTAVAVPEITRSISGATASIRRTWTFEVDDISLVPLRYMMLNTAAVKQAISDGDREIAGLRVFQEEKMGVR